MGTLGFLGLVRSLYCTHMGMAANHACRANPEGQGKPLLWPLRRCQQGILVSTYIRHYARQLTVKIFNSWIGPVVVGAISQSSGNVWMGWPFVLALFVVATIILFFIDVDAAKRDLAAYEQQYSAEVSDAAVIPSSAVDETVEDFEKRN